MESSHFSWHVPFTSAVHRCNWDLKSRARSTRATNVLVLYQYAVDHHLKLPVFLSGENPTLMQYLQMAHYLLKVMNSSLGKKIRRNKQIYAKDKKQNKRCGIRRYNVHLIVSPAPPAKLPGIQETDSRTQKDPPRSLQPFCWLYLSLLSTIWQSLQKHIKQAFKALQWIKSLKTRSKNDVNSNMHHWAATILEERGTFKETVVLRRWGI